MNLLGKIFVLLILLMSVIFMTLAVMTYATHKNWREEIEGPGGLNAQLNEAKDELEQLRIQYNRRESELSGELEAALQQVRKLETERVSIEQRNQLDREELEALRLQQSDATANVTATQQINQQLAQEVTDMRDDIRENQLLRDEAFASTLVATEDLHQTKGQLDRALERTNQLTEQVAGMTSVMRESGIDPATDPAAVVPRVDGIVSQMRRTATDQLVEVTIGSDDGLKVGNTVEVYRGNKYLGRVEILTTTPDKAVGRVDPKFQQGQILEGDSVATRLKLG